MMTLQISGTACITPLGCDLPSLWERLGSGERPVGVLNTASSPTNGKPTYHLPIADAGLSSTLSRLPRIRRASAITLYSVAAGLAALENAGLELSDTGALAPEVASRTAILFAVCSGGVHYTRRFYEKVVSEGPGSASPLLFPETVYNAPASHLAALLGTDGLTYTLVGDSCVGHTALHFAHELLVTHPEVDRCLIVGAEEIDWILLQGYATWRLLSSTPCPQLHSTPPTGMLLAEGAAALLVERPSETPGIRARALSSSYPTRRSAPQALDALLRQLPTQSTPLLVGSANGTWIDQAEAETLRQHHPDAPTWYPKAYLGETLGASALAQIALATEALRRCATPEHALPGLTEALATTIGLNQQVAATHLSR